MDSNVLRLECLKLAASFGLPPDQVIAKAKELYAFVSGKPESYSYGPAHIKLCSIDDGAGTERALVGRAT
jgi:hypothetical protein